MSQSGRLGIIGGSGLYDIPGLEVLETVDHVTPWGAPSDRLAIGRIGDQEIVFLPRHGRGHHLTPSELPYRANIYAMKELGVTHLLTVSAVGSLREELPPLTLVLPDQVIDRTVARQPSFFADGAVAHVAITHPYCADMRRAVEQAGAGIGQGMVNGGTYLCIEGPQFSTRAESILYRTWGASVIGMTAMPEARLAREAELCYATVALVTDYDVWHESEEPVTVEMVVANLHRNAAAAQALIAAFAAGGLPTCNCGCQDGLRNAIVTRAEAIPWDTRERIGIIADRYLPRTPSQ